jgi:glycine/D-amino acid oxidase-like deaminating enzyme
VIICGAGIIGASIAYYLTLKGLKPTVVDRSGVAAAAGGKGGGFLAGDWGSGVTDELHRKSFALHESLAKELNIESYRKITTLQVTGGVLPRPSTICSWLDGAIARTSIMDEGTAQVHPREYTNALMDAAIARGAKLMIGKVEGMETVEGEGGGTKVRAVVVDGQELPADKVVIAMGPWSVLAEDWLGLPVPMQGIWSTSVVYNHESTKRVAEEPYAMFCDEDDNGCHLEVYPRTTGEVYLCGIGGSQYMGPNELRRLSPEDIVPDPDRVAAAHRSFSEMSPSVGDQRPGVTQACMRPCLRDALPMMGLVPETDNAYIACGHNCWGILWAPITGLAMAELIADGRSTTVDLYPFRPERFGRPQPRPGARGRQQGSASVGEQW